MKFYNYFLLMLLFILSGFFDPKEIRKNNESFALITKQALITLKCKNCSTVPFDILSKIENLNMFFYFNAITKASSWIIHKKNNKTYFATSMHVCEIIESKIEEKKTIDLIEENLDSLIYDLSKYRIYFNIDVYTTIKLGNREEIVEKVLVKDKMNDFCIFNINKNVGRVSKLADDDPKMGEQFYTISAPNGIYSSNGSIIFSGFNSGFYFDEQKSSIFTIFSKPGSSGSPVYNTNNKIVGTIHSTIKEVNFVSLSTRLEEIKKNKKKLLKIINSE